MNIRYWLKKHWWKILLLAIPILIPMGLYALWWIKKHSETKEMFEDLSEKWHNNIR